MSLFDKNRILPECENAAPSSAIDMHFALQGWSVPTGGVVFPFEWKDGAIAFHPEATKPHEMLGHYCDAAGADAATWSRDSLPELLAQQDMRVLVFFPRELPGMAELKRVRERRGAKVSFAPYIVRDRPGLGAIAAESVDEFAALAQGIPWMGGLTAELEELPKDGRYVFFSGDRKELIGYDIAHIQSVGTWDVVRELDQHYLKVATARFAELRCKKCKGRQTTSVGQVESGNIEACSDCSEKTGATLVCVLESVMEAPTLPGEYGPPIFERIWYNQVENCSRATISMDTLNGNKWSEVKEVVQLPIGVTGELKGASLEQGVIQDFFEKMMLARIANPFAPRPARLTHACNGFGNIESWSDVLNSAITKARETIQKNKDDAIANPGDVVRVAKECGLDPQPAGHNEHSWRARCPGTGHALMIATDSFGCGYCRRNGGAVDLRAFVEERAAGKKNKSS